MAAQSTLERRLRAVYREAQGDLQAKLDEYIVKFRARDAEKRKAVQDGVITREEYDSWRKGAIFQGKMWRARVKQMTDSLAAANEQSLKIVRGEQMNQFAEGFNHEQFVVDENTMMELNFGLYDSDAVARLVRDQPELLPRKRLDRGKDAAWNKKQIAGAVTQGILQGESIDDIARRIARDTAQRNSKAMIRYARTATTSAQNAGRMETMRRAEGMGISCRKQWLATLDGRTRDAHAALDGQTAEIDEPFKSELGPIMFPGDPSAAPGNVYNCRCTMIYVYPEYPGEAGERLDNVTGEHVRGDMTYAEWAGMQPKVTRNVRKPAEAKPAEEKKKPTGKPLAGVEQGEAMTHEQADTGRVNPNFGKLRGYNINCQSCVVAYEARIRGYDIEVVPNDPGHPMCGKLSRNTRLAWIDRKTGETPEFMFRSRPTFADDWDEDLPTPKRFRKLLQDNILEDGRYHIGFGWKGSKNSGHIVTLGKRNGELYIYDPQSDRTYTGAQFDMYLTRMKMQGTVYGHKYYQWPEVLRVDDKDIDYDVAGQVVRRKGK